MNFNYIFVFIFLFPLFSKAQLGGENTYEFLNLTNSARMAALGGNQVALADETDLNVAVNNPALLTEEMKNRIVVNYVDYISDVNYGYVAYVLPVGLPGNLAVGMHYINYGTFIEALPNGTVTENTFQAAEYALNILWSYRFERFSAGINLKPVWSSFESYQSAGIAADLGAAWQSKDGLTTIGLAVKNFGTQITTYYDNGEREPLPFDVQIGYCQRLAHAPVRIAATLQHLQKWTLAQPDSEDDDGQTAATLEEDGLGKKLLRHLVLGLELLPSENFTLRLGYNYQRRQELKYDEKMSTVGFSFGLGFRVSRFELNYGLARYHLGGASNHLSLAINMGDYYRKK
jgi:opacity protein-like surface antigen